MVAIFNVWNHIFALFSKSFHVIRTKLGRDIASGKGHLVREFDLKPPWPMKMAAILMVWNNIFYFSPNIFLVIPTQLGTDIVSCELISIKVRRRHTETTKTRITPQLNVPANKWMTSADRSFQAYAPKLWNAFPAKLRLITNY